MSDRNEIEMLQLYTYQPKASSRVRTLSEVYQPSEEVWDVLPEPKLISWLDQICPNNSWAFMVVAYMPVPQVSSTPPSPSPRPLDIDEMPIDAVSAEGPESTTVLRKGDRYLWDQVCYNASTLGTQYPADLGPTKFEKLPGRHRLLSENENSALGVHWRLTKFSEDKSDDHETQQVAIPAKLRGLSSAENELGIRQGVGFKWWNIFRLNLWTLEGGYEALASDVYALGFIRLMKQCEWPRQIRLTRKYISARQESSVEALEGCWAVPWTPDADLMDNKRFGVPRQLDDIVQQAIEAELSPSRAFFVNMAHVLGHEDPAEFNAARDTFFHLSEAFTHFSLQKSGYNGLITMDVPGGN